MIRTVIGILALVIGTVFGLAPSPIQQGGGASPSITGSGGTVINVTGSSPIASSGGATPAISCPTCNTSAAAITANFFPKGSGGAQGLANSLAGDNGSTLTYTGANGIGLSSGAAYCWNSDAGSSRAGAATIAFGTCTSGNTSATINFSQAHWGTNQASFVASDGSLSNSGGTNPTITTGKIAFAQAGSHINTQAASTDVAGTIAVSASTTGTKTFTTNYANAPNCNLTPQADPTTTGVYWVTTTISTVVAHVSISGTINFTYQCFAATN